MNSPKELGLRFSLLLGETPQPENALPVHHPTSTNTTRANIREIFWAEVKARTVPFLRGVPAPPQLGRGGDAGEGKDRQPASPSPAGSRALNPDPSPKAGRRHGRKEALGKSPCSHHQDESLRCFPTAEQPAEPHCFRVREVKRDASSPTPACVYTRQSRGTGYGN